MNDTDLRMLVEQCEPILPSRPEVLKSPDGYESVPLCVIDAIYSIGVKYEGVEKVVARYKDYWSAQGVGANSAGHTTQDFLAEFAGRDDLAETLFGNRQLTSSRGGIPKADAVVQLLTLLGSAPYDIQTVSQLRAHFSDEALDRSIRQIHGQGSGISAKYLFLLAGVDEAVKPDRMIVRFVSKAIGRRASPLEAQELVVSAADRLRSTRSFVTPRILDHAIWETQRRSR